MATLRERVLARIEEKICPVCAFRGADGTCWSSDPQGCAILRNLDEIIDVVRTVRSKRMDPYIQRLRVIVCKDCDNQDKNGQCNLRDHSDCALDDYFELLVEIVEDEMVKEA